MIKSRISTPYLILFSLFFLNIGAQDCYISELRIENLECLETDSFYIKISFEEENTGDEGFRIVGNGQEYGQFEYGKENYLLGPLPADCETLFEFVVIDNHIDNCHNFIELDEVVCCDEQCILEVRDISLGACDSSGYRTLEFIVDSEGGSDRGFEITYNGVSVEQYKYGQNPYQLLIPSNDDAILFTVQDLAKPDCFTRFDFRNEPCDTEVPCFNNTAAGFIQTMIEFECTSDSSYRAYATFPDSTYLDSLWLSFYNHESNSAFGFEYQKLVPANDFPYLLGEFAHSDVLYYYYLTDPNNIFCYTANEWNDAPDCSDFQDCLFHDIEIEAGDCTDSGMFQLHFSFQTDTVISNGFTATVNGISLDSFDYGQLRYTTSYLDVECDKVQSLILRDNTTGCMQRFDFDAPSCCDQACNIYDIELYDFECNDDGSYSLVLDFEYQNNQNEFFDVWSGDRFVGFFAYRELPIAIDSFYARDVEYDLIKICDNDNPECCAIKEFMGPDCDDSNERCPIADLKVLETLIHSEGELTLILDFQIDIDAPVNLDMYINGEYYSTEMNIFPPFEFRYLDGVPDRMHIKICLEDLPDCCLETVVELEEPGDCELYELNAIQTLCDDGQFYLVINAEHGYENTDQVFELRGNGMEYGHFPFEDLPVAIGPFHEDQNINEIVLIVPGIDDCQLATALDISCDCTSSIIEINSEEFNISETNTELRIESTSMHTYRLELYTVDGMQVMNTQTHGSYVLRKENFLTGIYVLRISYRDAQKSFKIFIKN